MDGLEIFAILVISLIIIMMLKDNSLLEDPIKFRTHHRHQRHHKHHHHPHHRHHHPYNRLYEGYVDAEHAEY